MTERAESVSRRKIKEFGEGWSQEKLLCYDLRCALTSVLASAELLQESPQNHRVLEGLLKTTKRAFEQTEELFKLVR